MVIDDVLVFRAEIEGLRKLGNLARPKVRITSEELPGALGLWEPHDPGDDHLDDIRLIPGTGVPLRNVLRGVQQSPDRTPGGRLQIRGVASSFEAETTSLLHGYGAIRDTDGPHALMALDLRTFAEYAPGPQVAVTVADDAESLAQLRSVVRQVFMGASEDVEEDFFHAPGTMTYLAVSENGSAVATGSILIIDGVANIWSVATLPTARGRGAASAIMRAVCGVSKRQGAEVAALRTTNALAQDDSLYNRVGFSLVGYEHAWIIDNIDRLDL